MKMESKVRKCPIFPAPPSYPPKPTPCALRTWQKRGRESCPTPVPSRSHRTQRVGAELLQRQTRHESSIPLQTWVLVPILRLVLGLTESIPIPILKCGPTQTILVAEAAVEG